MKLYGVIGDPIAQSMSPVMQGTELKEYGIDAHYHPFHITPENLDIAIKGMKVIGIEGFNVTSPHKTAIIPLLDEIDPLAEAIGAVNTVVRKNNKYVGFNTDGEGYIKALQAEWKSDFKDDRVLIIGAGGAAKAIYYTLLSKGIINIDICNRTVDKAEQLIKDCPFKGNSKAISLQTAEKNLGEYNLLIQTTSIGMYPDILSTPISLDNLEVHTFVSDIIYNPFETAILKEARTKGAKTQNGLGMFVYQGALAFEKWTGIMPNTERMANVVIQQLGGSSC